MMGISRIYDDNHNDLDNVAERRYKVGASILIYRNIEHAYPYS